MNGTNDQQILGMGNLIENLHDVQGRGSVQASDGFIQQNPFAITGLDQGLGNADPSALPAR